MAKYEIVRAPGYFGPTMSAPTTSLFYPPGSVIEMADDVCSLFWKPLDDAARSAIAAEQQRQLDLRGGSTGWSPWGGCLPHGVGGTLETAGGAPLNWPPPPPASAAAVTRARRRRR